MLTIPDRKKKRENVDIADALCNPPVILTSSG
jgi:hypothetical protein